MRFVFVSYNYSDDIRSPEEWLNRLKVYVGSLECLAKEHTVMRVEQINYTGNFSHNGVHYYCIADGKRKNYFPGKVNRFVKSLQPDTVIVSGLHFPLQVIQLRLLLGKKTKIIAQNHAEKPFEGIKKYLQRIADRCIDAYFFASPDTGAAWVKKGNLTSAKKVHQVMEVSSVFYPVEKISARSRTQASGDPVFLWAGRLNENKDPLTVAGAFLEFLRVRPTARLYMTYQTEELLQQLKAIAGRDEGNRNAVVFVGKVPHSEMQYWFNSADFIISGSHHEGSGTAVCEAMSCGCVPVITDIPSFRTITGNGECGFLYKAGDKEALLSALMHAVQADITVKRNKTLDHFRNHLSFEAIANKIQDIAASL
jgi:glycosyltransferase involved in cell wall biosynthesis